MNLEQLKAYLANPDVALDNMKRAMVPSEGQEVETARNALMVGGTEPTNDEILDTVADNRRTMDNAAAMAGTVAPAKSTAQLLRDAPSSAFGRVVVKDAAPATRNFGKVRTLLGR